ncbi:MAG TPA: EF-P lysine aminoacylase EpmA [Polyangiaceae bacterium]|nr:EF-P lysine aminoacylase EpmA [Polyangiaceae bacterium]
MTTRRPGVTGGEKKTRRAGAALSPSDVVRGKPKRGKDVAVGGRVVLIGEKTLVIADSLATLDVALVEDAAAPLSPGELVRVEGVVGKSGLVKARVVERHAGQPTTSASEFGRLVLDGVGWRLAARATALRTVRAYFEREKFVEVETPVRVASPGLDAHVDAVRADGGFLITSPELHMKRLIVGGLPRLFQLARVSRANEHGALHEPEFTMLEWYRAFAGMEAVIRDTERLVEAVVARLAPREKKKRTMARTPDGRAIDVTPPFDRITMREAFREHAGVDDAALLARTDPDSYFKTFVDAVEPGLASRPRALVLHEFPVTEAALARPCPDDPTVAERFELYVGGVELCNGFGELTDPVEQRRRFEAEILRRRVAGAPEQPLDEPFLSALAEGMPPSGGNALGFDRLVMLALGASSIADVTAFPAL